MALLAVLATAGSAWATIEIHEEHQFKARPGAAVVIDVSFHEVEVTARPGDTVDVAVDIEVSGDGSGSKDTADALRPEFIDEGDRLVIRSTRKKIWNLRSVRAKGRVVVAMPPGLNLTIDSSSGNATLEGDFGDASVDVDLSSGNLTIDGAMAAIVADMSSGSIRAAVDRPLERFRVDVSSGAVHLSGGAREVQVDSSSGNIEVSGILGNGRFDASSGNITARWDSIAPEATVHAQASSGNISLTLPAGTRLDGIASVSSGSLRSDFPGTVKKKQITFTGGPGAVSITANASSGNVKLFER
jgi:DUF4097 and DUF4098 domain-containing protein YvlB